MMSIKRQNILSVEKDIFFTPYQVRIIKKTIINSVQYIKEHFP